MGPRARPAMTARRHLLVSLSSGTAVAAGVAWIVPVEYWLLIGWDVACLVYLTTVWTAIWPRSVHETARLAEYTDPTRAAADALALSAAVASLGAVAVVLISARPASGPGEIVRIEVRAGVDRAVVGGRAHPVHPALCLPVLRRASTAATDFNGDQPATATWPTSRPPSQ